MFLKRIPLFSIIILSSLDCISQVFPWSGYTASQTSFTPYTYVIGGMSAVVTPNVPGSSACTQYVGSKVSSKFFSNPTVNGTSPYSPRYITASGSGDYNLTGLLLAVEWPTVTCSVDVDITFTPPVCAPVYFDIFDINTDGGTYAFSDVVTVSAKNSGGTTVYPTVSGLVPNNSYNSSTGTVASTTPTSTGGNAMSSVRFTFPTGNIASIKITYKSNSTISNAGSGCSGNNNGTDPYYQYIVIGNINAGKPTASITSTAANCGSSTVTLTGTTSITSPTYSWTGPSGSTIASPANQSTSVTGAGTYTLTVTSSNGCSATATYTLTTAGTPPNLTTGPDKTLGCASATTTISASSTTPGVTYSWSGTGIVSGGTTSSPAVNAPNTYTVTVTDGSGCSKTGTVTVTSNITIPNLTTGGPVTLNCLVTNGIVSAGSTTPGATFKWTGFGISSGGSTPNATVIFAGTYTVTVTDPVSGCTKTGTVTVTNNTTPPNLTTGGSLTLNCSTGSSTLTASSSTSGVTYSWSGPGIISGGNTSTPTVNKAGTYTVTVTNPVNGCKRTRTITVTGGGSPPTISSITSTPINCNGQPTGSATVNASGSGTLSYLWNTTATTQSINNLVPGTYSVTVTDISGGCTATSSVTLSSPPALTGQFTKGTSSCSVSGGCGCREWILITATGGTSPYTYTWPDGYLNRYKNQLCPGTYTINIRDKNGCSINTILTTP